MGRVLYWLVVAGLAAPALTLTAVRVLDTDVGSMIRLESFTPFGLPLYAATLVLLGAGLVLHRGGPRSLQLLGAVAALAGLAVHAWWFAPQVSGDNPPPAAGAEPLTVLTVNLFEGRGDPQEVVDAVRREGVDLLVLEEITPEVLYAMDAAGLPDLLPNRIGEPDRFVAGTMVFSSLPTGEPDQLRTSFGSYRVQVGDLTLLAVHPTAPVLPAAWREEHDVIREEAVGSEADLIVGDLNATPDHDVLRELDDAGFRDAGELANEGWQPTWPANHLGIAPIFPPLVRIDHVLLADTLASLGTHSVDIEGTDHLGLVAEIAPR